MKSSKTSFLRNCISGWNVRSPEHLEGGANYSQNIRTCEELYDKGYIKADTYSITQSMLSGELLGSFLLRAVLTLCLCLVDKSRLYAAVALS